MNSEIEMIIRNQSVTEDEYKRNMYQILFDLQTKKNEEVITNIKECKIGWKHPHYKDISLKLAEQDEFIVNPYEVEEGALECRCGSRRVFSFTKQIRSADEPATTFAQCVKCGSKWTYSG